MTNEVTVFDEKWASQAKQYASTERTVSGFITHRAGQFKAGEMEFPELCAIILESVPENAYYGASFDPNKLTPPKCFAFGEPGSGDESEMAPHPAMQADPDWFEPQSEDCKSCQWNQFGSAEKGKGKACKNGRRLVVIPAGTFSKRKGSRDLDLDLYVGDDVPANEAREHLANADAYVLKVPPTSIKEWRAFVHLINNEYHRPPQGVVTRIWTEPMTNGGHKLCFEPLALLPDDTYPVMEQRNAEARATIVQPYSGPDKEEKPQQQPRGLKRLGQSA